jgi:hypothetical protein
VSPSLPIPTTWIACCRQHTAKMGDDHDDAPGSEKKMTFAERREAERQREKGPSSRDDRKSSRDDKRDDDKDKERGRDKDRRSSRGDEKGDAKESKDKGDRDDKVGLYKLRHPADHIGLTAPGVNPRTCAVKTRFQQSLCFSIPSLCFQAQSL